MGNVFICQVCFQGIPLDVKAVVRRDERGKIVLFHQSCAPAEPDVPRGTD